MIQQIENLPSHVVGLLYSGDIAATKLYFQVAGGIEGLVMPKQQNNFIQINGITVNLSEEQVKVIEGVLGSKG